VSGIRSHAKEVAGGARQRVARWCWPNEAAVQCLEEGETPGGPSWAGVGRKLGRLWEIPKKIEMGCQGHRAELKK
jgi:hypothetical protein